MTPVFFDIELAITNLEGGGFSMKQKKKSDVAALLDYAGSHRGLTFLGIPGRKQSSHRSVC